jgi:hypothetical protein
VTIDDYSSSHLDDDRLLGACRSIAAKADPAPPEVVAGALAALSWRTVDAELAELLAVSREPCITEPLTRS